MERIYSNQKAHKGSGGLGRYIQIPCSESDILYLEQVCMMPGIHHITAPSLASGREMIMQVLRALAWHQDVGYITLDAQSSHDIGTNITQSFQWPLDQETLESFFINSFYYDFLLIESSPELFAMPWIEAFEAQLMAYKIDAMIPIIVIEKA